MIRFFAKHPTAANLLMLVIVFVGVTGTLDLRRETFPEFTADRITVTAVYPGAAAETVDESVVSPIEEAVDGIEFLSKTTSAAREGVATVTLEMADAGDIATFKADVEAAVESVTEFPADVEDPRIEEAKFPSSVIALAVTGPMSVTDLELYCELLKHELAEHKEISSVDVAGFSERQLQIRLRASAAAQYGLSVSDLAGVIAGQSLDAPVGSLETGEGEIRIRYAEQRRSPEEFEDLVVVAGQGGGEVRLGDIADVRLGFEDEEKKILFNGERAGLIRVSKTSEQDALRIRAVVEEFRDRKTETGPPGVTLTLVEDAATPIAQRLELLTTNGVQGLILVFLTLWLFFNTRLASWVAAGLPVSFLGGLWVMSLIGYTLNMMTMMSLLLALGLLMDDGIVLADNVAAHLRRGKTSLRAAIDGVMEVWPGVLSSFLTTICVFAPLTALDGQIGRVLLVIPVVLIAVLAVSLIEAFAILPNHLAHSLRNYDIDKRSAFRKWFDGRFEWFREHVVGWLVDVCVRRRYATLGVAFGLFAASLGLFAGGVVKFEGFPATDGDQVSLRLRLPAGTPLNATAVEVDRAVAALDEVNASLSALQPDGQELVRNVTVSFAENADSPDTGSHVATIGVDLLSVEVRATTIDEFTTAWRDATGPLSDATSAKFSTPTMGPGGAAVEIRVQGSELELMNHASEKIVRWFGGFEGAYDLMSDLQPGTPQVRIVSRPGALGTSANGSIIAAQLQAAFSGVVAQEVRAGQDEFEISVQLDQSARASLSDLEYFDLQLAGGRVPLGSIARIERDQSYARVSRVDGRRTVSVTGSIDADVSNAAELMTAFEAELLPELNEEFPGLGFEVGGATESSAETGRSMLIAFSIGVFGVFFLLSFQFRSYIEPVVVLIAIPFALVGVLWGNLLLGTPLTLPGILGFVSLAGVVVNDSILLVLFIKKGTSAGQPPAEAAAAASRSRFRAVLLTSATTVAGLTPLMFERSAQAQVLVPVASSIVFGILASTVLLLLVLPALYGVLADFGLARIEPESADDPH